MCAGIPYVRAAKASACAWLPGMSPSVSASLAVERCLTGAVCHHSLCQFLRAQPRQCMERAADLECANSLVILTFEEEVYPRVRWYLPLEGSTDKGFWFLRGRCKVRENGGS